MTPSPPNRAWVLAEVQKELQRLEADGTPDRYEWKIDTTELEKTLVLFITMPTRTAGGGPHSDGEVMLRLDNTYYPTDPPIIHYVNPDTKTFDPTKDAKCLPRIAQKPPGIEIAFHLDHDNKGQLVCHSLSFEYYYNRAAHSPAASERWDPAVNTIGAVLMLHDQLHRAPYYGGRQG